MTDYSRKAKKEKCENVTSRQQFDLRVKAPANIFMPSWQVSHRKCHRQSKSIDRDAAHVQKASQRARPRRQNRDFQKFRRQILVKLTLLCYKARQSAKNPAIHNGDSLHAFHNARKMSQDVI